MSDFYNLLHRAGSDAVRTALWLVRFYIVVTIVCLLAVFGWWFLL